MQHLQIGRRITQRGSTVAARLIPTEFASQGASIMVTINRFRLQTEDTLLPTTLVIEHIKKAVSDANSNFN